MTKKIIDFFTTLILILVVVFMIAALFSCNTAEEGRNTKNNGTGFNEINVVPADVKEIEYNDGWGHTETENIITETVETENIITETTLMPKE